MQVVVNNLLTNYVQKGSGKNVLLLHGWGDSSKGMHLFIEALAKKYKVTSIDLPGFGGTQAPSEAWSVSDYAGFVQQFAYKIGLEPALVIGHSNGGAIAIRALSGGLVADKLVLVASAGIRGEYKGRMQILRYITKAGKAIAMLLPKRIQKKLRRKLYTTVGSDMLVAEHLQETFKKVVADDVRQAASTLTVPTLLIYGDNDVSTPLAFGRKLEQAIPNSRLEVIPGGEHGLPTENTQQVINLIKGFDR